ncbi:MAG: PKD domain-containing protein, partial [Flavobacteriales bacterium]
SSEVSVCEGTSVQFHQEATGVQYAWNFGVNPNFLNTSTGHVSFTFSNPGDYTVQSVIQFPGTNGACADTSSIEITVLPRPEVSMNLSANEGCGEVTVTGDVSAADSYLYVWSFMPSPSFQVGTQLDPITFNSPGNHPISVAVTGINGCQSTAQQFVTVHPQPEADFAFDGVCFGETTSFSDESIAGINTNITGWYWQFGDGGVSYESNPSHDYAFTGDYNVSLTVTTPECTASTSQFVGINPNPTVEAQADILSGCSPLEVAFNADASLASTFAWEIDGNAFNGASVDATLETAIGDASVHTATITVTSAQGCSATDDITVEAFPRAIAQIDPAANAGCAPYTLPIANLSEGAIAYEWYANGNFVTSSADWTGTLENINNAIESQTVELVAHSVEGCNDTTATTIQVYPEADFTFDLPNDTACSPLELTMPMMEDVNSFTWNFGGGNTSDEQAPSILLENTNGGLMGTSITFTGVSVFGCVDSHTETVYVRPQPVAEFSSDALEGCEPLAANFENISSDADSYVWDFGNGITDDGPTASQAFYTDGTVQTYDITLTAYDDLGCTDTDTLTVTVFPAADFTLDLGVETACSPLEMTLPVIAGAQNVAWDFGDGTTSNEATPDHAWENATGGLDNYIVSVTGETEHGCAGLAVDLITVKPQPTAAFNADALSGCEPLDAAFTSTSTAGTDLSWNFGDGTSATGSSVNHTFDGIDSNTAFDVTLTATHPLGCADVATATVDVFAAAEYTLNLSADSVCSPLELTMPEIAGAQNVTWNFGDGTTSNEATPTHTWFNASTGLMTATVTLEAETADGCAGTSQATVNIKPQPVANFMVANDEGCDPLVSQFNNYSVLADSYDWDFGDGTTGHEEHPTHAFAANGATTTFAVTLTAHDDLGCFDATTRDVTVHPAAAFSLNLASDTVCSPLQLTLPAIPGAENLTWNFGD